MSRTAHHPIPRRLERGRGSDCSSGGPWRSVRCFDLRYSGRVLAEAAREGRRPRPRRIVRRVDVYAWGRYLASDREVGTAAALAEGRERTRLRAGVVPVRAMVNGSAAGGLDVTAAEWVDLPPARHRRNGLYQV
ncbi:hypothetical protein EHYA_02357 [Embleya hyalina]|uniref:Uncharacterized protein n=1 Tax=Embleya hyalina TaxID=516124 RepID=A0A401YJD6_9ACTN|nr:hypothetical protein EHYA_02357 [Embleya hyalina]